MSTSLKRAYFDQIAEHWDSWIESDTVYERLDSGLTRFNILPNETIADLGCGTGNLITGMLRYLSEQGRVLAIDYSERMLSQARAKVVDTRVDWILADAEYLPLKQNSIDRVICLSTWPHFSSPDVVAHEIWRILKPGGWLHIWHIDSRDAINSIHSRAGGAIALDLMLPAIKLADLLGRHGFESRTIIDDAEQYLLTLRKV